MHYLTESDMIDRRGLGLRDYKYTFILFSTLATLAILFSIAATGIRPAYAGVIDDTIPPQITCPADIQEQATSPADVSISGYPPVTFADFLTIGGSASDNLDTSLDYLYSGPSQFPIGITFVTHTVIDDFGNSAGCTQLVTVELVPSPVEIDIKPGSNPNSINLKKDKTITVAVLGSSTFDVNTIDRSSLSDAPKFGGATPQSPIRFSLQDVNKDGYVDLVLQYKLLGLGFNLSSTEGCITGMLTDGTLIEGCDSVRIVPPS